MTRIRSISKQIRRVSILPLLCIAHFNGMAQVKPTKPQLNLDFEKVKNGRPIGWGITSNSQYAGQLDSGIVQHGKYSVSLAHLDGEGGFGNIGITIPYSYPGKKITLSGYLKTENVSDGFAGLWMRIDPKVAFDNMNKQQMATCHLFSCPAEYGLCLVVSGYITQMEMIHSEWELNWTWM